MDNSTSCLRLLNLLKDTFNYEKRKNAEKELNQMVKTTGVLPNLLYISMNPKAPMSVRYKAITHLQNCILSTALPSIFTPSPPGTLFITNVDAEELRRSILSAFVHCPESFQPMVVACFQRLCVHDFRHSWQMLIPRLADLLRSRQDAHCVGGLAAVYALIDTHPQFSELQQCALEEEIGDLIPYMKMVVSNRPRPCPQLEFETLNVFRLLLKCISLSLTYLHVSVFDSEETHWRNFDFVVDLCKTIFKECLAHVVVYKWNESEQGPVPKVTQEWFRVTKAALYTIYIIVSQFGETPGSFSKYFAANHMQQVLELIIKLLGHHYFAYVADAPDGKNAVQNALLILGVCAKHPLTFKYVMTYTHDIITRTIFPLLSFSEKDDQLLKKDPATFFLSRYILRNDPTLSVTCCDLLLYELLQRNPAKTKRIIISTAAAILSDEKSTPAVKYGAIYVSALLAHDLSNFPDFFLTPNCLLPYLTQNANYPSYLQLVACWIAGFIPGCKYKPKLLTDVTHILMGIATSSDQYPPYVKAMTGISLRIIANVDDVQPLMKPHAASICTSLAKLMQVTNDCYNISSHLNALCGQFITELKAVYVYQIFCGYITTFLEHFTNSNKNDVCTNLLQHMTSFVINVNRFDPEWILPLQKPTAMVMHLVFSDSLAVFYDKVCNLIFEMTRVASGPELVKEVIAFKDFVKKGTVADFLACVPVIHNYILIKPYIFEEDFTRLTAIIEAVLAKPVVWTDNNCIKGVIMTQNLLLSYLAKNPSQDLNVLVKLMLYPVGLLDSYGGKNKEIDSISAKIIFSVFFGDEDNILYRHIKKYLETFLTLIYDINPSDLTNDSRIFIMGMCYILRFQIQELSAVKTNGTADSTVITTRIKKLVSKILTLFLQFELALIGRKENKPESVAYYHARKDKLEYVEFQMILKDMKTTQARRFSNLIKQLTPSQRAKVKEFIKIN